MKKSELRRIIREEIQSLLEMKRISKAEAKRTTNPARWKKFEEWMKKHPHNRPTFWFDGGQTYARIGDIVSSKSFSLSGQYNVQD